MFPFSRRGKKLGRVKVQLSDSPQGGRSPIRHPKRANKSKGDNVTTVTVISGSDENSHCSSTATGNSEGWKKISTSGDKPTPRFNHASVVIGKKMIVVGGESGKGLLEDVQILDLENYSWTTASSRLYLSPSSLQLKIQACKGHCLVPWEKKVLLIGGRTSPPSDRVSVWAFDVGTESWSLVEAKGDIPIARSGHTVVRAGSKLILFGGEDNKRRKLNDLHMFDLKSLTWLPLHCKGAGPSARCNHVATLYDDKLLLVFGGTSKSKSLNDLFTLDFETMMWSRIKIHGFHPSPRAGCCGVLCGIKWYIAGGGSRKKRHAEILVFDILKLEWSIVHTSSQQSITTNKGRMMTDSYSKMMSDIGMRSSNKESGMLKRMSSSDHEMEINMYRSGSAPPTVDGSFNAVAGLFDGGISEQELRSDPAYVDYYHANVNLNPRLPPPLLNKDDWRFSQRLQSGGAGSAIGDMRKVKKDNGNAGKAQGIAEWGGNGLIGLPGLGLGSRQKSIAEIIQVIISVCKKVVDLFWIGRIYDYDELMIIVVSLYLVI